MLEYVAELGNCVNMIGLDDDRDVPWLKLSVVYSMLKLYLNFSNCIYIPEVSES